MYYPYFRGKQYELITVRETAQLLAKSKFIPIIEPVKKSLSPLKTCLDTVCKANGEAIVIVNPKHGDYKKDGEAIFQLLNRDYKEKNNISAGIYLNERNTIQDALKLYTDNIDKNPSFIYDGFSEHKLLSDFIKLSSPNIKSIFFERKNSSRDIKYYDGTKRIIIGDGFEKRKNAEYLEIEREKFSDLHLTYKKSGMDGFGDFLTVGDGYSEKGGPAYAVAIHITFIDKDKGNVMYVYHFVSFTNDTSSDPGGKFSQALDELIEKIERGRSHILETSAIIEFRRLHQEEHFPGLGYVKKLSMKHHIETLADFFSS